MNFFRKKNCHTRNGVLVLDLSTAKVPGIARVDLSNIPVSYFQVRSGEQGSVLGFSDAQGQFTALATFADRGDADTALADARKTLIGAPASLIYKGLRILTVLLAGMFILSLISSFLTGGGRLTQEDFPRQPVVSAPQPGAPMDADSKLTMPNEE